MQQRRRETRFKIFTAEVVSLRLVSYPKAKIATFTQARNDGQEVEVKPTKPIVMKKVWRPKRIDSSSI